MNLPTIAQHAKLHGIIPDKKLGQNFLFDISLCEKIARVPGHLHNKFVLEIGPGPGGLSRAIAECGPKKLFVIEKDKRCIELLKEIHTYFPQLEIINADALNIKLSSFNTEKIVIIANLPYNIGTELLFRWLDEIEYIESMTLMLQKEVVDRICAKPDSKAYGKLSIMCQIMCDVEKMFDVSPAVFYPPPKVTSSIVKIIPKSDKPTKQIINSVRMITSFAFNQRRKMLKSSLKSLAPNIIKILDDLGISSDNRAEDLSISDYIKIAQKLENKHNL